MLFSVQSLTPTNPIRFLLFPAYPRNSTFLQKKTKFTSYSSVLESICIGITNLTPIIWVILFVLKAITIHITRVDLER